LFSNFKVKFLASRDYYTSCQVTTFKFNIIFTFTRSYSNLDVIFWSRDGFQIEI